MSAPWRVSSTLLILRPALHLPLLDLSLAHGMDSTKALYFQGKSEQSWCRREHNSCSLGFLMVQEEEKLKGLYRETALKSRCLLKRPAAREPLAAMAVWRRVKSALRYASTVAWEILSQASSRCVTGKVSLTISRFQLTAYIQLLTPNC